jgi:hypothetical protein
MIGSRKLLLALALLALCSQADAQQGPPAASPSLRLADLFRTAPGTNVGSPAAFGPAMGDVFVGGVYQNATRGIKNGDGTFTPNGVSDGSISLGFGIGDASEGLGLSAVVTTASFRSGAEQRTSASFSVFRNLGPTLALALGVENLINSGAGPDNGVDSWYGVITKVFAAPSSSMSWLKSVEVSAGVGNGRFRFIDDAAKGRDIANVFGAVSALVHDKVALIADWTGQDLNLGASFVPFSGLHLAITPLVTDLVGTANGSPRFVLAAGIATRF